MKTARTSKLPPLYTQVIGSLPRPKAVQDLQSKRKEMDGGEFDKIMDDMVCFAIRLQEQAGLDVVSDGEWRRIHYIGEFFGRVGGFEPVRKFTHQGVTRYTDVVVKKMKHHDSVFAGDARFLVAHATRCTKFALPSPFLIAIRYWRQDYSTQAYPTLQHFMDHLSEILAIEAKALAEAGIDIVQLDDPALTYFCDRRLMEGGDSHDERLRRNWDIDTQFPQAVACINRVVEGIKAEVHLHCCHSVYKRQSDVSGDYKPILPRIGGAKIDRINLEFAYHGTGQAEDLKLLPPGIGVGMGVVDVRGQTVQSVEEIATLARAGVKILGKERMALNPDCGFAPDAGEPPTIDEAFLKLQAMCAAARKVRGEDDKVTR
jgi:5-methyltetrahydropteroyltriglutamate--homocysteine methyltransferase